MSGRARGRSRGRARGGSGQEASAGAKPGAGGGEPPAAALPPAAAPPASGRASQRGAPKGDVRPGGDTSGVTRQMGGMSLGPRGRRRGDVIVQEPRTRPDHITDKCGTNGKPIQLVTNFFKLNLAPDYNLYQYHVDFSPDILNRGMRSSMVKEHREKLGPVRAFDGMMLFLPHRLPSEPMEVFSTRKSDGEKIRITFKLTAELPPTSPICLQMYNIILKRILSMIDMRLVGRHYFNPQKSVQIPKYKMEVWPGFITSILQYESSIMLMTEISHKILRTNTMLDLMYELHQNVRGGNFYDICSKKVVGEIVLTRYNNKTYRIDDIDWKQNPNSKFKLRDESEISFVEYYKKTHDITVKDLEQPLLISMPKMKDKRRGQEGPIVLLPELCTLTGLSDDMRNDFHMMKDLAVHTRLGPQDRCKRMQDFIDTINSNDAAKAELAGWGFKFSNQLLNLNGRVVNPENILQGGKKLSYNPAQCDWSRDMRGVTLNSCVGLENWVTIFTQRDDRVAQDLVQTLSRVCPPMGIRINRPEMIQLRDDRTESFLSAIKGAITERTQIVLCLLPSNRKDRYDAIKKLACIETPIPSQMVLTKTLSNPKRMMSVVTNVGIQMNCKLGGEVWAVEIPLSNLMICGFDTYHDSAKKGQSVGGFVASINSTCTRYYSKVSFQTSHQELCDALKISFTSSLKKYHQVNNTLPDRIVIFRDGVGDGQLPAVAEHEIPQLLDCFKTLGADYNPRVAIVVVKKRISSRFFSNNRGLDNPPPGTIVDTEVTRPEWYDFFLISQSVRQGTVSPTHFNVVYDTTGLKPDHIQRLAYKMCHLYYNWPGTIRVPAPCQYAHKLAFLVGQSLHKEPSPLLSDKLFFL